MVVNSEFLHRCIDTQMFFFHGFYNHSLELRRISFVWYSFCRKNPEGFSAGMNKAGQPFGCLALLFEEIGK